jgi:hypothetical protein
MRFAGVEITPETIQRTREHFAELHRQSIADAKNGVTRVNNLASYVAWQEQAIADGLAGKSDHTFTFMQRAHWLQTGEMVPLLST